ncbi:MAG: DNA repair protein RecO [Clostridia bacterium]|nr:DNA repair protein RecO [Clostridia bacterium]
MKFTSTGLIIREYHVGESDRLVTVLTRDHGLVRAFASGARSVKGKKQAATQLLSYGNFVFSSSKDTYRITEAECLDVFFDLRGDLVKLSLAQYFCELCGCLAPEQDEATDYLRLMLNGLKFLEQERISALQVKAVIEFSLLTLSGYMPYVDDCHVCDKMYEQMYFDPMAGVLACKEHMTPSGIPVTVGVVQAIYHITHSPLEKQFFFNLSEAGLQLLSTVSEAFMIAQLDREFKTLDFYHSFV